MYRKKFSYLMLFVLVFFSSIYFVDAAQVKVNKGKWLYYNTYGISRRTSDGGVTTGSRTSYKTTSAGAPAYCMRHNKSFSSATYKSCSLTNNQYNLIVSGQIVDYVNKKGWSAERSYVYSVAAINTFWRKDLKLDGAAEFLGGKDVTISTIVSEAKKAAKEINGWSNKDFISGMSHTSTATMNKLGNSSTFISKKVTITGFKDSYAKGTPSYVVTAEKLVEGQRIYLYSDAAGKNLIKEITTEGYTVPAGTSTLNFYVKSTGANADNSEFNFTIKVSGSVKASYLIGATYCYNNNQSLILTTTKKVTYSGIHVLNFKINKIDKTSHKIEILKVDHYGEPLAGAAFAAVNPPVTLSGPVVSSDRTRFTFTYGPIEVGNDQFYGKNYCFRETTVPEGYVAGETEYCTGEIAANETSSQCLDSDGNDANSKYCNTDIKYVCKVTTTPYVIQQPTEPTEPTEPTDPTDPTDPTGGDTPAPTPTYVLDPDHATVEYREYDDATCNAAAATDDGTTQKVTLDKVCGKLNGTNYAAEDMTYCDDKANYQLLEFDGNNLVIRMQNNKNVLKISKKAATGDDEVPGAELKICTEADYNPQKNECTKVAKTVANTGETAVSLSWVSGDSPAEFNGIKPGTYYLVETLPPTGFKKVTTATKFTMGPDGTVKIGNTTATDNTLVLRNQLSQITISKTDIATSKELPGAKISICVVVKNFEETDEEPIEESGDGTDDSSSEEDESVVEVDGTKVKLDLDEDGECIPAVLADGTDATWTSTDKPKVISGLPAGTYYLVEKSAPKGYSTAEAILFKLTDDGVLTDKDGKSLADNKLVMKDAPIEEVKTGMLPIILAAVFGFVSLGTLLYVYVFRKKKVVKN